MPDFEELSAGLRRWASMCSDRVDAAVELLIWHETFLRRSDFFSAAVGVDEDRYYIRWDRAQQFVSSARGVSSSQSAVMLLAVWLATDPFGMSGFGRAHQQAAVDAFAAALGVTSLSTEAPRG